MPNQCNIMNIVSEGLLQEPLPNMRELQIAGYKLLDHIASSSRNHHAAGINIAT